MLDAALSKTVVTPDGNKSGKRVLASLVAQALTTGQVQFPGDDKPSTIGVKDWLEFAKWFYQYMEPPITRQEHTGADGGALTFVITERRADGEG